MSNLDVALTLRLINDLSGPAKAAGKDLQQLAQQAKSIDGAKGTKLAGGLEKDAAAAKQAGAALKQAATEAKTLAAANTPVNKLAGGLEKDAAAAKQAGAALKQATAEAKMLAAVDTSAAKLASELDKDASAGKRASAALKELVAEGKSLSAVTTDVASIGRELTLAARAGARLATSLAKVKGSASGIDSGAGRMAGDLERAAAALKTSAAALTKASSAAGRTRKHLEPGDHDGAGGHGSHGYLGRQGHSLVHALGPVGVAVTGGAIAGAVAEEAVKASAHAIHERVRMRASGVPEEKVGEAEAAAKDLSARHMSTSQTEIMHLLRNASSITGSLEEAKQIMDPLLDLRTVALGAHPEHAGEMDEDLDKLVKGLEIKGVTQNMGEFRKYMDGMAKAINVFGDTLKPTDFYEMFKYGSQATSRASQDYMLTVAPTLAQELGGSSAGVAMQAIFSELVGGHTTGKAAAKMDELGLLTPDGAEKKKGQVVGVKPGGVVNSDLAATNLYEWVQQTLLPAFARHQITDPNQRSAVISSLFPNHVAARIVELFATQQTRFEKDRAQVKGAEGLDAAKRFETQDPMVAFQELKAQADNLAKSFGLLEGATSGLVTVAKALGWLADLNDKTMHKDALAEGLAPTLGTTPEKAKEAAKDTSWWSWFAATLGANAGDSEAAGPMLQMYKQLTAPDLDPGAKTSGQAPAPASTPAKPATLPSAAQPAPAPASPTAALSPLATPPVQTQAPGRTTSAIPAPPAPMATGSVTSSAGAASEEMRRLAASTKQAAKVDLAPEGTQDAGSFTAALSSGLSAAEGMAASAVARLKAMLSFTATPTIAPRIAPAAGGAAAAPAPAAAGGGSSPSGAAPKAHHASLRGSAAPAVVVREAHFHGVRDVAGMHRQIARLADRAVKGERAAALHDVA